MVAKPWKCAMVAGAGLVLLLTVSCTNTQPGTQTGTGTATATAVACPNQSNHPREDSTKVDRVLLVNKNGTVLDSVPGTACGVVWDQAARGPIPSARDTSKVLTTMPTCVWVVDHWECPRALPDSSAQTGVKK